MIDIVFVVRGNSNYVASSKYRVFQYLRYLSQNHIKYKIIQPPRRKKVYCYLWVYWIVKLFYFGFKTKKIFIQKDIYYIGLWKLFKKLGKKIIYDFDDAVFVESTEKYRYVYAFFFETKSGCELVADMISLSDCTIVANKYLEMFARKYSDKVSIVPMCLIANDYQIKNHKKSDTVIIGWIGSPHTTKYLSIIKDALLKICLKFGEKVEIVVITNGQVLLPGVKLHKIPWDASSEMNKLHSFDIGIVPISSDPFTLGKSSFKLLQFMVCGLPVVCSNVGFNKEVIINGENGYLATNIDEWVYKLTALIEDLELRIKLGKEARKTIEDKYSFKDVSSMFLQTISKN